MCFCVQDLHFFGLQVREKGLKLAQTPRNNNDRILEFWKA